MAMDTHVSYVTQPFVTVAGFIGCHDRYRR